MVYCQVMFFDLKARFATSFKTANLIKPDDSPPALANGKTSLMIEDLEWTQNDAFVIVLF